MQSLALLLLLLLLPLLLGIVDFNIFFN